MTTNWGRWESFNDINSQSPVTYGKDFVFIKDLVNLKSGDLSKIKTSKTSWTKDLSDTNKLSVMGGQELIQADFQSMYDMLVGSTTTSKCYYWQRVTQTTPPSILSSGQTFPSMMTFASYVGAWKKANAPVVKTGASDLLGAATAIAVSAVIALF